MADGVDVAGPDHQRRVPLNESVHEAPNGRYQGATVTDSSTELRRSPDQVFGAGAGRPGIGRTRSVDVAHKPSAHSPQHPGELLEELVRAGVLVRLEQDF